MAFLSRAEDTDTMACLHHATHLVNLDLRAVLKQAEDTTAFLARAEHTMDIAVWSSKVTSAKRGATSTKKDAHFELYSSRGWSDIASGSGLGVLQFFHRVGMGAVRWNGSGEVERKR